MNLDIATLAGLGLAIMMIAMGLGSNLGLYINIPSIMIVLGGTLGSIFIAYPMDKAMKLMNVMLSTMFYKAHNMVETIRQLVTFSEKARREGLLSLEQDLEDVKDTFMKKGLQLVVDGIDSELLQTMMETDMDLAEEEMSIQKGMMDTGTALAPAFGMIGTLVGLIQMLSQLNDPSTLGPAMAVALITTFYGAVLAYVFFMPMGEKLSRRSQIEMRYKRMILEGILSIQAGDNPRILEEKLKSFLTEKELSSYGSESLQETTEEGNVSGA